MHASDVSVSLDGRGIDNMLDSTSIARLGAANWSGMVHVHMYMYYPFCSFIDIETTSLSICTISWTVLHVHVCTHTSLIIFIV